MLCSPGESLIPAFMRQTKLTSGEQQQQQEEEEQQQQQRLQGHVKSSLSWWFTVPNFINPNLDPNWWWFIKQFSQLPTIIPLLSSTIDPYSPTNILQLGMVLIIRFTSLFRIFHLQLSKLTHLRLILTSCKLQPLLLLWSHHWGDLITSPQCQNAQHWQRTEQEDKVKESVNTRTTCAAEGCESCLKQVTLESLELMKHYIFTICINDTARRTTICRKTLFFHMEKLIWWDIVSSTICKNYRTPSRRTGVTTRLCR